MDTYFEYYQQFHKIKVKHQPITFLAAAQAILSECRTHSEREPKSEREGAMVMPQFIPH